MNSTNSTTASILLLDFAMTIPVVGLDILFGLPTHSYVIWLIITGNGFATEFFNLNHSFCEIGICVDFFMFLLSSYISNLFPLALFFQGLSITGRPLFQCLICVERYLAVVHPVTFLKYKPLRYRLICCSAAWIITLCSCLFTLITLLFFTIAVHAIFFSIQFLIYLPIQLFCLVAVLRALKQSGPGERKRDREEENHTKRRAFNVILITTVTMAITYVPSTVSGIFTILTEEYNVMFWIASMLSYVLAGFVQPVLYLHRVGKLSCFCS